MHPPPAYQIQGLLENLYLALRADSELLAATGAQPDEIIAGILDSEPKITGAEAVNLQEVPALCAREESTEVIWGGQGRGFRGTVRLWYVLPHPVADTTDGVMPTAGDDMPVTPEAAADRLARCVWWQVAHYLQVMHATVGATTLDLTQDAQIYAIRPTGRITFVHRDGWILSQMPLQMDYYLPPWAPASPTVLEGIDVTLYDQTGDPDPFTDGIQDGLEYDVPT